MEKKLNLNNKEKKINQNKNEKKISYEKINEKKLNHNKNIKISMISNISSSEKYFKSEEENFEDIKKKKFIFFRNEV